MTSLTKLADRFNTDKHQYHGYMPAYEAHLPPRDEPVRLLEIGVMHGESLKLWDAWFTHPDTEILGLDVADYCRNIEFGPRVSIRIIDAKLFEPAPDEKFNVIIDDGSHDETDIMVCMRNLWQHVAEGGLYVVEDLNVQRAGNLCLTQLYSLELPLLVDRQRELSEVHIYPEIWFGRRRGLGT